jgi:hypothetical protein
LLAAVLKSGEQDVAEGEVSLRFGYPCVGAGFQRSRNSEIARFGGPVSANTGKEARLFALQGGLGLWVSSAEVSKRKFRFKRMGDCVTDRTAVREAIESQVRLAAFGPTMNTY